MMNKPEVFVVPLQIEKPNTLNVCGSGWGSVRFVQDTEVVRLTDYEADRAADKARIAELERLLLQVHTAQKLHYGDGMGLHLEMIGLAQHIDAALSQPKVDA